MPQNSYGSDEKVCTWLEHCLPPVLTYLVRKANLYFVVAGLFVLRQASKPYGFSFEASVSDRDAWCWDLRESVPGVHAEARIER